jgi:putative alpha-1,2-mannosidase
MTALGLFDVQGHASANPTFQLGSPVFEKVSLQLENNPEKKLLIQTINNSTENVYVQDVQFNGNEIENCWINRATLMSGGELIFQMDSVPNKKWGVKTPPPSMSDK